MSTHSYATQSLAERYAGVIASGLSIDSRHQHGLGPVYGPTPALESAAEAWTRGARDAVAGVAVAFRGLGPSISAARGVAGAGLSAGCRRLGLGLRARRLRQEQDVPRQARPAAWAAAKAWGSSTSISRISTSRPRRRARVTDSVVAQRIGAVPAKPSRPVDCPRSLRGRRDSCRTSVVEGRPRLLL